MTSKLAALPRTPDELADAIWAAGEGESDPHGIADSQDNLRALITRYQDENVNRESLERQIDAQIQRQFANLIREEGFEGLGALLTRPHLGGSKAPAAKRPPQFDAVYNPDARGAGLDAKWSDRNAWPRFIRASSNNNMEIDALKTRGELQEFRNAFTSDSPADGGYLITSEVMRADLTARSMEGAMVRPRAIVLPMSTLVSYWPVLDETTHSGSVMGGIVAQWLDEAQAPTASEPRWAMLELRAHRLSLYTEIPDTLLKDAPGLATWINVNYPKALRWAEDLAFIKGNGVGKPLGFLNSPAAVEVAKETDQAADTILWENIVNAFSRMLPDALMRAEWFANLDTLPQLLHMSRAVGTGGSLVWIGEGQGSQAPPVRILGRPVNFSEKMPTRGDAGDITFWDPQSYVIGDREQMFVSSSEHFKFNQSLLAVKVLERVDGQTTMLSALTPETGSNTLSCVVKIEDRP